MKTDQFRSTKLIPGNISNERRCRFRWRSVREWFGRRILNPRTIGIEANVDHVRRANEGNPGQRRNGAPKHLHFRESENNDNERFPYFVQIGNVYDGPLDLLLAVIKKQNLDIWDLPIGEITAQFLAYVKTIPAEEVDSAAEFCYMASQLIVIKCRHL